eukprot:766842-Hanusia_phi.AAC.9
MDLMVFLADGRVLRSCSEDQEESSSDDEGEEGRVGRERELCSCSKTRAPHMLRRCCGSTR